MAKKLIFSEAEAKFLTRLVHHRVEFMIIGLAAAALQGAPVVTQDIDLWFKDLQDPKIKKALKDVGGIYVPSFDLNPPMLAGESVKLFDIVLTATGLGTFAKEKKNALAIDIYGTDVPVLALERIIKSKRAANRAKDRLTLPVLEDALKASKKT